jgi:hypothetical protein
MRKIKGRIFLFIGAVILLSGCTHQYALTYTPVIEKQPSNNIIISLNEIEDLRENKESIGYYRNLYFIPIDEVQSIQSPKSWISYALETELTNAGYNVNFSESPSKYSITGNIHNVFIDFYLIKRVNFEIDFSILEDNNPVFSKTYTISRTTSPVGPNFDFYLQEICGEFISDVNTYFLQTAK